MQEMQLDSTTLADTTTEEVIMDDEPDSVALVGVNESDFDLVDETSKAPDPQSLVIKVGDTFPELEGFGVLHIAPVITYSKVEFIQAAVLGFQEPGLGIVSFNNPLEFCLHFERPRVAYNLFDQMPKSNGLYKYWMMPKNVTAQHMLLHFPFDPGSANGLISEGIALVFDNSLLCNLLYSMFGEMLATGMGDRAGVFADQVFDGKSQKKKKNNHECIFLFASKESILISLSYHDCRIPIETEGLSRNAAFLQSILNLQYGHQFSMYHCHCLDTGQTPSLMTLSEAVQSWRKCLDNEPATVGVFVTELAVEATQSNLMEQMLDKMPPYCSKVFDPRPSAATVILATMVLYLTNGHSEEDHLFIECPQLVDLEFLVR